MLLPSQTLHVETTRLCVWKQRLDLMTSTRASFNQEHHSATRKKSPSTSRRRHHRCFQSAAFRRGKEPLQEYLVDQGRARGLQIQRRRLGHSCSRACYKKRIEVELEPLRADTNVLENPSAVSLMSFFSLHSRGSGKNLESLWQ